MRKEYARKVRILYGTILGILTLIMALLLIFEAADLYYDGLVAGGQIYSREIAGERLRAVIVPAIAWLIVAILGYVISVVSPITEKSAKKADPRVALRRLKKRIPAAEDKEFRKERKKLTAYECVRIIIWSLALAFTLAASVIAIIYLANTANFKSLDVNGEIKGLVSNVLPWVLVSMLLVFGATVYESLSAKWELRSAKKLLALGKGSPIAPPTAFVQRKAALAAKAGSDKTLRVVRIVVLIFGLAFLVAGILNGGAQDVLIKAINICTECIGLG